MNLRNQMVIASSVAVAADSASRRRGLLGLDAMPDGQAMVIAPCSAIHTWFMRFAIDVAFVARNGQILKCCDAVQPWRMALAWRAFAVIELGGGTLEASKTVSGDVVHLVPAGNPQSGDRQKNP